MCMFSPVKNVDFCFYCVQITHKHYERRLLVAESCGVLAPYIPVSSLVTYCMLHIACYMLHVTCYMFNYFCVAEVSIVFSQ